MALGLCRRGMFGVIRRRPDGRVRRHSEVGGSNKTNMDALPGYRRA